MKKFSNWAIIITLTFLVLAGISFIRDNPLDATIWMLYGISGLCFSLVPHRTKDTKWHTNKILSYIFLLCAVAVCIFKYFFLPPVQY